MLWRAVCLTAVATSHQPLSIKERTPMWKQNPFFIFSIIFLLTACQSPNKVSLETAVPPTVNTPQPEPTTTPIPPTGTPILQPTDTTQPTNPPPTELLPINTPETIGTLNYIAYFGGQPAGHWDHDNFNAYQETHPGLETSYYGGSIYTSPVPKPIHSRLTREETADVFSSFIVGSLQPYVEQGLIMDISDIWAERGWDEVFPATLKEYVSYEGRQYFVPQAIQWNPIWYSSDIFAELGLAPPQTWDEFLTTCNTLHEAGYIPVTVSSITWTPPLARWFTILNLRLNGPDFHESLMRGDVPYDDPRVRDVFVHWQEMFAHNCFDDSRVGYGEAADQIYDGRAAMYNLGEWLSESYSDGLPETLDFFSFPPINPDVPPAEIVHLYGAYIHANTPNLEQAEAYLTYLGNVESQTSNVQTINRLVANKAVDPTLYNDVYLRGLEFVEDAGQITQLYELNTHPDMAQAGLRAFSAFFADPDDETIDEILTDLESMRGRVFDNE
ncbi:MAG: extracellular solute-binding protein [Chloroflexi bacterium]|nr:extracellular solute-binding protein [Chloroflexota bacterium]